MGSVGAPELIVIFLVALIVLGPDRLPKAARQMGRAMAEFKRVTSGFQDEVRKALDTDDDVPGAGSAVKARISRGTPSGMGRASPRVMSQRYAAPWLNVMT